MSDRLGKLRQSLKEWLARNELDGDTQFWTPAEWRSRHEDYLRDAELVLTFEGGLHFVLNYNFDHPKVDELQDLIESFGYMFEMGHSWNMGFFQDAGYDQSAVPAGYREKLRDDRWRKKSKLIRDGAGNKCQDCGASDVVLEAHHCWYRYGLEPWQYPLDALRCLCRACHAARPSEEYRLRELAARLTHEELREVREAIERLYYWYDRQHVRRFFASLGPDEQQLLSAARDLIRHKTEPGADG